ncbi:MAG: hypothetical protein WC553_01005 [Patescibacteria group bacterium]|jgi:hypothetical protein
MFGEGIHNPIPAEEPAKIETPETEPTVQPPALFDYACTLNPKSGEFTYPTNIPPNGYVHYIGPDGWHVTNDPDRIAEAELWRN